MQLNEERVASAPNFKDFLAYMSDLVEHAADIRSDIGTEDLIERKIIVKFLENRIDTLRRMNKQFIQQTSPSVVGENYS